MKRKINRPNMKIKTLLLWSVTLAALAFASCSGDDTAGSDPTGPGTAGDQLQTVRLYLNVPSTATARVGDPGYPTGEGEDWDQLAVMIESANGNVITANNSRYFVRTLSKSGYDALPEQSGYHWLPIDLVEGSSVYIYGVTYSSTATNNPAQAIENVVRNSDSFANIEISNNYSTNESGQIDAAKFLSVATGYYADNQGERAAFTVRQPEGGLYDRTNMPTMTLTRLAAKIDIQWDAQDAYVLENNENIYYEDVSVDKFTFYTSQGNTDVGDDETGTGFLFPDLNPTGTAIPGKKGFYNTSPISKRNGRVYHYVFPDGENKPYVTFYISAIKKQEGTDDKKINKKYTFNFTKPLQKSTWYKINTTIKGLENDNTTIEITPEGPGGTATTE